MFGWFVSFVLDDVMYIFGGLFMLWRFDVGVVFGFAVVCGFDGCGMCRMRVWGLECCFPAVPSAVVGCLNLICFGGVRVFSGGRYFLWVGRGLDW